DVRPGGRESSEDPREKSHGDALVDAYPNRRPLQTDRLEIRAGGGEPRRDLIGVGEQADPGRRDRHRTAPTGPQQELAADEPFEAGDLLTQGREPIAEALSGAAKRSRRRHRVERGQVPELDALP